MLSLSIGLFQNVAAQSGGGGGGGTPTTLNPADIVNVTLTNGNLTSTNTGASGTVGGARSIASITSGKYYWEITIVDNATGHLRFGVSANSTSLSNAAFMENYAGTAAAVYAPGVDDAYFNGAVLVHTAFGSVTTGTTMTAYDATNKLIWFGHNGTWMNTSNPSTGTGGASVAGISTTVFPFIQGDIVSTADSATFNFGATAYSFTPPTGFGNVQ